MNLLKTALAVIVASRSTEFGSALIPILVQ
jgi:hypothetical protein